MVYFPEEVFRNIASYLVDPYKEDKEKHAKLWQHIRVKRERYTHVIIDDDFRHTNDFEDDMYCVYTRCQSTFTMSQIPTRFYKDDHLQKLDNVHECIDFDRDYNDDSDVEHDLVEDY